MKLLGRIILRLRLRLRLITFSSVDIARSEPIVDITKDNANLLVVEVLCTRYTN